MTGFLKTLTFSAVSRLALLLHPVLDRDELLHGLETKLGPLEPDCIERKPLGFAGTSPVNSPVSVIIPVKNGGADLVWLLQSLREQQGMRNPPEVIVVDSGSLDGSVEQARRLGAICFSIPPESFNHGATRNLAAEQASGEILVFTTQDALPDSDRWLWKMASTLSQGVAAASCIQRPRPDADLFARWLHKEYLRGNGGFPADCTVRLKKPEEWPKLTGQQKFRAARLDNNALCIRKELLLKYRFIDLGFGEEMELASRLLRTGERLAFLQSVSVIHSHTRPAEFFLKRAFVEERATPRLLGETSPAGTVAFSPGAYLYEILRLYDALALMGLSPRFRRGLLRGRNTRLVCKRLLQQVNSGKPSAKAASRSGFHVMVEEILAHFPESQGDPHVRSYLVEHYAPWLRSLLRSCREEEPKELQSACLKLLAWMAGRHLASLSTPDQIEPLLKRGV